MCGFIQPCPGLQLLSLVFPLVSSVTTREDRDGETGEKGCTSLDGMPTEVIEQESDAKERFTKQLLFGSSRVTREELDFIWASVLLCLS